MIILQDSQIKKIFHNGDEVKKILDWDGNVIFYKQSGGGGMTNTIKFTTSPSVSSANVFTVTYTDSTQDTVSYSEPSKEYSLSIPTDKVVNKINFDNKMVYEVKVSCKINLSSTFFTNKPKTIRILNCDSTSSTSFNSLFSYSTNVETIEMKNSDFSNVTDMSWMFRECWATTIGITNCNISNVTNMSYMFAYCSNITSLDLSGLDLTKVTNMDYMFRYCNNLKTIKMIGCNKTTIDKIKAQLERDGILNQVTIITGDVPTTNYIKFTTSPSVASENNVQVTYADSTQDTVSYSEPSKEYSLSIPTDKVVTKIGFDNTMVDEVKVSCKINLSSTFFTNKPKTIRFINCDATSSTSLANLFSGSTNIETIEMKDLDASNVTDMSKMFYDCSGATTIDIANCNTSKVTYTYNMFSYCRKLTSLDLSNFNTSNVTDMGNMFYNCSRLTSLDLSNFDTSNVTYMNKMFEECQGLTSLDLSNFNTSNVTDMSIMFSNCRNLTSLNLSNFDTSNVTDMSRMFFDCSNLTSLNLSNFNTSKVTNMYRMFIDCSNLTSLDLSGWDMEKVTNMNSMFNGCSKLTTIRMIGCNQTTIDKIKSVKPSNATIITE